jgi:hypothetical protein
MASMHQRMELRKKSTSPTKRMSPMNQRKEMRDKLISSTIKKPKATLHPRALNPHWRIMTAPAKKGCIPIPISTMMRG